MESQEAGRDLSGTVSSSNPQTPPVPGIADVLGSLQGMARNAFGTVLDRVEVVSADVQAEKQRFVRALVLAGVAVFSAMAALLFVSGALVLLTWHTAAGPYVVAGLGATYTFAAIYAGLSLRRLLREARPFSRTLAQLQSDRQSIVGGG